MQDEHVILAAPLRLIAASVDLLQAERDGRDRLAAALRASVPEEWPPEHYDGDAIDYAIAAARDPTVAGVWCTWYFLLEAPAPTVVGIGGFTGAPDAGGTVELGYSVLPAYQGRGCATHATRALTHWAYAHGARTVVAHTLPELAASVRVLEKCGFTLRGPGDEAGVVRYEHVR